MRRTMHRHWARLTVLATALFLVLATAAAVLYPGGTWFDRSAQGHDLWRNFLCDLLHARALNGTPNPVGSRLAVAALLAECVALAALWQTLAALLTDQPVLRRRLRRLGAIASVALVLVPLTPSDRFPWFHGIAIVAACTAGFGTALLSIAGLWRARGHRDLAIALGLILLLAVVDFTLYVHDQFLGGELVVLEPALQRVATALLVLFTFEAGRRASRAPAASDFPGSSGTG